MLLKVNLGAGLQAYEQGDEYTNVDIIPSEHINYVWDLEDGLPKWTWFKNPSDGTYVTNDSYKVFQDNTVDEFIAFHCLEHIRNLIPLMDEIHSALKPDGIFHIKVPNAHHVRAAWSDPTHVRAFTPETFDYFTHATLAAYPYTKKEWTIVDLRVNGIEPDDLWEIEVWMRPVK